MKQGELYYKGKLKARIQNDEIVFIDDIFDFNALLESTNNQIVEEEDEFGGVIFQRRKMSLNEKLILLADLGFEVKHKKEKSYEPEMEMIEPELIEEDESSDYAEFLQKRFSKWEKEVLGFVDKTLGDEFVDKEYNQMNKTFGEFLQKLFNAVNTVGFLGGLRRALRITMLKGVEDAEEELNLDIGVGVDFDKKVEVVTMRQMEGFTLDGKKWKGIKGVSEDVRKKILKVVGEGINENKGTQFIKKEIKDIMTQHIGGEVNGTITDGRAMKIARTESNRMRNDSKLDAFKKSEVVKRKQWFASDDERTTEICRSLDNQIVGINEFFIDEETGKKFQYPPAHVNCRSTIRAVLD